MVTRVTGVVAAVVLILVCSVWLENVREVSRVPLLEALREHSGTIQRPSTGSTAPRPGWSAPVIDVMRQLEIRAREAMLLY